MRILTFPIRFGTVLLTVLLAARAGAQMTEVPQTVEPGKALLEMDWLTLTRDSPAGSGARYSRVVAGSTLVSFGLTPVVDVQVGVDLFVRDRVTAGGAVETSAGRGDAYVRLKWAFWQDEKSPLALALLPYLRFPTSTGGMGADRVEGGLILPIYFSLSEQVSVGGMLAWDHHRNAADDGNEVHGQATFYVQRTLNDWCTVYAEAELALPAMRAAEGTRAAGVGVVFQVTKMLAVDYQVMRGINARALDWAHVFRLALAW